MDLAAYRDRAQSTAKLGTINVIVGCLLFVGMIPFWFLPNGPGPYPWFLLGTGCFLLLPGRELRAAGKDLQQLISEIEKTQKETPSPESSDSED